MKNIFKIMLCGTIFIASSCDYSDVNVDPNNPVTAPAGTVLLTAETFLSYSMYDDMGRIPGLIMQQIAGSGNQSAVIDRYNITESDINTNWSNMYRGAMNSCLDVIEQAEENGSPHMSGAAKVVLAITLGNVTDVWGDVPWSEALRGSDNLTPVYDSQEFIYSEIQRLLDEAIVELSSTTSGESPSANNDRFYGGNLKNWIAAAYTAKAKYYNNLSEIDPAGSASSALAALDNGFTSVDQDMAFEYITDQTGQNPIGSFFNVNRVGDASMGEFYVNELSGDPRLPMMVGLSGGAYVGAPPGENASGSGLGSFYNNLAAPTFVLTFAEAKFIEAEAALRANNLTRAQAAFQAGIQASMDQYGVDPVDASSYIAANGTINAGNGLEMIIREKYLTLFLNPQTWTDWRRTGFPNISPAANNATSNQIPVKLPYPQQERTYNGANVNTASGGNPGNILANVWWDK